MDWYGSAARLGKTVEAIRELRSADDGTTASLFRTGQSDACLNVLPADALLLTVEELFDTLRGRFGGDADLAVSPGCTDPARSADEMPSSIRGPATYRTDTEWIRRTNMVGVNVRTVGDFFGVVKYALTLSRVHDSIHILPIWEPGVVGSLYGMSSRHINGEFYSASVADLFPHLNTPARQLKGAVNLLHLLGKSVGMDVIPHTDRFSEVVLAFPHHFEWLRREDTRIVDHRADLHEEVMERIQVFLRQYGAADGRPIEHAAIEAIFDDSTPVAEREYLLFGPSGDPSQRSSRRKAIARFIYRVGYEPVPATMAPPYRGLRVDTDSFHRDEDGHIWREYTFTDPEPMSRVFGPLARYKLYERLDDNRKWEIDFSRPRREVWEEVQRFYASLQDRYGFDFMRGDMSHVQMRRDGTPPYPDEYYDLLGSIAAAVRRDNGAPSFAYFAESFIAPPGTMAYGNEVDHLEACGSEVTLGDLQSLRVDDPEFFRRFRLYRDIMDTRRVTPSFTVMTADKDDPRFDDYYLRGNEARYFTALFLVDMPSYTALNFECRDPHFQRAPNEHYTKLYVFHESDGPKATAGPFRFGENGYLFYHVMRIRLFAEELLPSLAGERVTMLLPPDGTGGTAYVAWRVGMYLFVVNYAEKPVQHLKVPLGTKEQAKTGTLAFSTEEGRRQAEPFPLIDRGGSLYVAEVGSGEGIVVSLDG